MRVLLANRVPAPPHPDGGMNREVVSSDVGVCASRGSANHAESSTLRAVTLEGDVIAAGLAIYGDGICDSSVATRASALPIADDSSLNTGYRWSVGA